MEDVVSVQHANCNDVLTSKDALLLPLLLLLLLVMADAHLNTIFFISIFLFCLFASVCAAANECCLCLFFYFLPTVD